MFRYMTLVIYVFLFFFIKKLDKKKKISHIYSATT